MTLKIKVPSIACEACATAIINSIAKNLPATKVRVDVTAKIVEVETEASEESIREAIVAIGHEVEEQAKEYRGNEVMG
jgi:copper chaperone